MTIDGRTRLAGVIGWPVEHSLSPVMHNTAYKALGLNWAYIPLALEDEATLPELVAALRALRFVGFNVTMPYKREMLSLCDEVAMFARMAGAVNTVHCVDGRLMGYNTDGRGLLESLQDGAGFLPAGKRVVILGTGGAAGGAMVAFVLGKVARLTVAGRDVTHAERLIERAQGCLRGVEAAAVALPDDAEQAVREADLVVNATSLGMRPDDPSPVPAEWLRAGQVVCDMAYACPDTALLADARAAGATALDGLGMLVAQGALAVDIWMGSAQVRAPRDVMRAAALDALRARRTVAGERR